MEELLREMARTRCLLNATAATKSTSEQNVSSGVNGTCDEADDDVLGWVYASEFDVLRNPVVAAAVVTVYVLVIIVGTLGSLLVFVSVVRTRQMWTATNVFIANLAFTDLVVCAFDLPLSLHYQVGCTLSCTVHDTPTLL